jgi:ubiquinone/menaquinone biosynthesis C-methylase UbiE
MSALKQRVIRRMVSQFGRPRGTGGRLAGWVMAHRSSNRQRNRWVVCLLDVRPSDRILEIGFGPGLTIANLAGRATAGHVYGLDHSELMVRQASKRSAAAIRAGRVTLLHGSVEQLPNFDPPLDAIVSVNSVRFWPDPVRQVTDLRGLLHPGGRIALALQPRIPGATAETTTRAGEELRDWLIEAGFTHPRVETLPLDPPVACVLAVNPPEPAR